jgi:hypothetical protein
MCVVPIVSVKEREKEHSLFFKKFVYFLKRARNKKSILHINELPCAEDEKADLRIHPRFL